VNVRRLIVGCFLLLFLGLGLTSGVFFWQTRAEYERLRALEAQSQRRLAAAEARLQEQQKILDRLRTDPVYVEQVIRGQLHYAKPDEYIFRFEK
jgi:cell division protein DivIC